MKADLPKTAFMVVRPTTERLRIWWRVPDTYLEAMQGLMAFLRVAPIEDDSEGDNYVPGGSGYFLRCTATGEMVELPRFTMWQVQAIKVEDSSCAP